FTRWGALLLKEPPLRLGEAQLVLTVAPGEAAAGALGHAVRLPLGIHRLIGRRYPLFDAQGHFCAFPSTVAAARFILGWPRASAAGLVRRAAALARRPPHPDAPASDAGEDSPARTRTGTYSPAIRWVDAHVSPLELLANLAPESVLRPVGRGFLGWCPFHDGA